MASVRDIRRRIKGVKATGKITRAMEMISAVALLVFFGWNVSVALADDGATDALLQAEKAGYEIRDVSDKEAVKISKDALGSDIPKSDGVLVKKNGELVFKDSSLQDGNEIVLPIQSTGEIEMSAFGGGNISIDLPDDGDTGKAVILNTSTVVYPNTGEGVDTVVTVPNDSMFETWHIIRSHESPKSFDYKSTLPAGGAMRALNDTTIVILNSTGLPEVVVHAPEARDDNGQPVPIRLSLEGENIVLYVDHGPKYAYPIIADPTYRGISMNKAEWAFCSLPWNWSLCVVVNDLADESTKKAEDVSKKYKWSLHNGGADAFRHCYWSGLMTMAYGTGVAKGFGDRHEENADQPKKEKEMGIYNNKKGRGWSDDKGGIYGRCVKGVKNKELMILTSKP